MRTSKKAIEKLKEELVNRFTSNGLGFRVCQDLHEPSNPKLALKLDTENPNDETIKSNGVKLFLDQTSSSNLRDFELDYIDGPAGGFVLRDSKT